MALFFFFFIAFLVTLFINIILMLFTHYNVNYYYASFYSAMNDSLTSKEQKALKRLVRFCNLDKIHVIHDDIKISYHVLKSFKHHTFIHYKHICLLTYFINEAKSKPDDHYIDKINFHLYNSSKHLLSYSRYKKRRHHFI